MSEVVPETTPESTPPSTENTLTHDEVKSIVGDALDEKLNALGISDKLEKMNILDDLETKIAGLFETHKTAPADNKGLLTEIDNLIGRRLSAIPGTKSERKPGWLGRWLAANSSGD